MPSKESVKSSVSLTGIPNPFSTSNKDERVGFRLILRSVKSILVMSANIIKKAAEEKSAGIVSG